MMYQTFSFFGVTKPNSWDLVTLLLLTLLLLPRAQRPPWDQGACKHHPRALGVMTCSWWRSLPSPLCWESRAGVCSPLQRFGHFPVFGIVYGALFVGRQLPRSALFCSRHDPSLISSVSLLFPLKPVLSSSEASILISSCHWWVVHSWGLVLWLLRLCGRCLLCTPGLRNAAALFRCPG